MILTCILFHFFPFKLETLENLSPAVLSSVGMLCMNNSDVNWPLLVDRWLAKRPEREVDVLRELCDRYIGPTLEYLASKTSVPPISGAPPTQNKPSQLRHVVSVTEMGMVNTLLTVVEVRLQVCWFCFVLFLEKSIFSWKRREGGTDKQINNFQNTK